MRKLIMMFGVVCLSAMVVSGVAQAAEAAGRRGRRARWMERFRENAPPEIKELMDKRAGGQELTQEERDTMRNYFRQRGTEMRERMMQDAPEDVKAIMEKRGRGEQLSDEEQQRMRDYMRNRAAGVARGPGPGARPARRRTEPSLFPPVSANPRDAALLKISEIKHDQGNHQEAIDTLAAIIAESPEPELKALAHLVTARIYRKSLALPDKAAAEFLLVRGALRDQAVREMIEMYEESGEPEQGIKALLKAADEATEKPDKVYFLMHAAEAARRAGKLDDAIEILEKTLDLVSYDEALEMMKDKLAPTK